MILVLASGTRDHVATALLASKSLMSDVKDAAALKEDEMNADVAAQVNSSAMMLGSRLRQLQKQWDEAALVAARQERMQRSAAVFKGDAGIADGLRKLKVHIGILSDQLSELGAAIAASCDEQVTLSGGKAMTLVAARVLETQLREERTRLMTAVSVVSSSGLQKGLLQTVRHLAAEGELRGAVVPPRGARPVGIVSESTPEDTIVHHYVGENLPLHLCLAADMGEPEDMDDEALDAAMSAGPRSE
jgi:hypothetical protein